MAGLVFHGFRPASHTPGVSWFQIESDQSICLQVKVHWMYRPRSVEKAIIHQKTISWLDWCFMVSDLHPIHLVFHGFRLKQINPFVYRSTHWMDRPWSVEKANIHQENDIMAGLLFHGFRPTSNSRHNLLKHINPFVYRSTFTGCMAKKCGESQYSPRKWYHGWTGVSWFQTYIQ